MNWLLEIGKLEFGFHAVDDFPSIAALALSEGEDTPSLRILAGLSGYAKDSIDIYGYLCSILKELGIEKPSRDQLAWILIRHYMERIIDRELCPHEGVHIIVWQIYNKMDWSRMNGEYAGDSIGMQVLYGLCDTYDDLLESEHRWDKEKTNEELLKEIEKKIYQAVVEYKTQKFRD